MGAEVGKIWSPRRTDNSIQHIIINGDNGREAKKPPLTVSLGVDAAIVDSLGLKRRAQRAPLHFVWVAN